MISISITPKNPSQDIKINLHPMVMKGYRKDFSEDQKHTKLKNF